MQSSILSSPHMYIKGSVVPKLCRRSSKCLIPFPIQFLEVCILPCFISNSGSYELPHHHYALPWRGDSQIGDLSKGCRP